MRRLFWVARGFAGVTAALDLFVGGEVIDLPTAEAARERVDGVTDLAEAVREGMDERETELRFALGIDTATLPGGREMSDEQARDLIEDPTSPRPG